MLFLNDLNSASIRSMKPHLTLKSFHSIALVVNLLVLYIQYVVKIDDIHAF